MKAIAAMVLLTAACATAQDYPYPDDWNPNAPSEVQVPGDTRCADKYRGRRFTCTITRDTGEVTTETIWTDRLPPEQRPGEYDLTIPLWDMTCACKSKGKGWRTDKAAFLCYGDGGAFDGAQVRHSNMKGHGYGAPFGGSWKAVCNDFDY